ncbi:MAG TPA: DUF262 domain-containing protein [Acidimicrobiales bacterium]|nr:DUF262 domain-containing protein [Acidimicrobiales bacterium]
MQIGTGGPVRHDDVAGWDSTVSDPAHGHPRGFRKPQMLDAALDSDHFSREFHRKQAQHNRAHPGQPLPRLVLHGLRHTCGTVALNESIDIHVASDRLKPLRHLFHPRHLHGCHPTDAERHRGASTVAHPFAAAQHLMPAPRTKEGARHMAEKRETTTRSIAWFLDLRRREGGIDLDPPYQRRSVWNQSYRDYFIDTIVLDLPVPAVFLFETIGESGSLSYSVVDGKQRLSTIFDFIDDEFPVSDDSKVERLRGRYFSEFSPDDKRELVYSYIIPIEVLPTTDEQWLDEIFQRINRNVSRLSHQELRHARFSGDFSSTVERLSDETYDRLPDRFPNIAASSQRQMKDVEFVVLLVLLVEHGPQSTPQQYLDEVYAERDDEWEGKRPVLTRYRKALQYIIELADAGGAALTQSRLRNQGDFYALFGAVAEIEQFPDPNEAARRLSRFAELVSDEARRDADADASDYYEAARSAANDPRQRRVRIQILKRVVLG